MELFPAFFAGQGFSFVRVIEFATYLAETCRAYGVRMCCHRSLAGAQEDGASTGSLQSSCIGMKLRMLELYSLH